MRASAILVVLGVAFSAGCGGGALRATRGRLAAGDLAGAVEAAGANEAALRDLAFHVLGAALREAELRDAAATALAGAGPREIGALEALASSDDPFVATAARAALLAEGETRVRPGLEASLASADGAVRALALGAIGRREHGASLLGPFLQDPDDRVRRAAVAGLGGGRDEGAAALLADAARRDPDGRVRADALRALGRLGGDEEVLEAARAGLEDEAVPVRLAALGALAHLEDRAAATSLLGRALSAEEPAVAVRAAAALAALGDEGGLARLRSVLLEGSLTVAAAAAVAAQELGEACHDALVEVLERPEPALRVQAAASLLRLGDEERAVPALVALLETPGWPGLQAALALVEARPAEAREGLARALRSEEPGLRAGAAGGAARAPDGLALLRPVLSDGRPEVRVAAAAALLRLLARG